MAYDFVQVALSLAFLDDSITATGRIVFEVDDFVLDTATGAIVIVPPITLQSSGSDPTGVVNIPFLAMDSQNISRNWHWLLSAELTGGLLQLPRRRLAINLAAGAQQSFRDIFLAGTPA